MCKEIFDMGYLSITDINGLCIDLFQKPIGKLKYAVPTTEQIMGCMLYSQVCHTHRDVSG